MYSKNTKILSSFKTIVCQLIKVRYIQKIQKKIIFSQINGVSIDKSKIKQDFPEKSQPSVAI